MLKAVDGMAPIDDVTAAIDRILSPAGAAKAKAGCQSRPPTKPGQGPKGGQSQGAKGAKRKAPARKAPSAGSKGRNAGRKAGPGQKQAGTAQIRTRRRLTKAR